MFEDIELRRDGFLDGRLQLLQPVRGYRSGADAVMLAAACPARPGDAVLELGCGAGVAILCLGWRVPGLRLTGLEAQPAYAELARRNGASAGLRVVEGDLTAMPAALRAESFDAVIANPPYFRAGTAPPDPGRETARHEAAGLPQWIDAGLRRLRPGGTLTLIHKPDRLAEILGALEGRAGGVAVLPLAGRAGQEAGRIIVSARKGARAPLRLLAPLILHEKLSHERDEEDISLAARKILREGCAISLQS